MENTDNFAVIRTGGKQYRVCPGQKIRVEKLSQGVGEEIHFPEVLFVKDNDNIQFGKPVLSGAEVVGEVLRQFRDKKLIVFKKRSKKGYKKMQGHRQSKTEILIKSIHAGNN